MKNRSTAVTPSFILGNIYIAACCDIANSLKMKQQTIFTFRHAPEIYADSTGQFFRTADDRPIRTIYHAGRVAVRNRDKIYGIKRLRKNAIKTTKQIQENPF